MSIKRLQIETLNYIPFYINDWDDISQELKLKLALPENVKGNTGTVVKKWDYENFGKLYTELEKKFTGLGFGIDRARLFYTKPKCALPVHVDGTNKLGHYYWAINFPIHVPEDNHFHEWYSYTGEYFRNYNQEYTDSTLLTEPEKIKVIDRLVLNKPYLVKVGIPHAVLNHASTPRLILSIRFYTSLENTLKLIESVVSQ
jgi:hypothetical protein